MSTDNKDNNKRETNNENSNNISNVPVNATYLTVTLNTGETLNIAIPLDNLIRFALINESPNV